MVVFLFVSFGQLFLSLSLSNSTRGKSMQRTLCWSWRWRCCRGRRGRLLLRLHPRQLFPIAGGSSRRHFPSLDHDPKKEEACPADGEEGKERLREGISRSGRGKDGVQAAFPHSLNWLLSLFLLFSFFTSFSPSLFIFPFHLNNQSTLRVTNNRSQLVRKGATMCGNSCWWPEGSCSSLSIAGNVWRRRWRK